MKIGVHASAERATLEKKIYSKNADDIVLDQSIGSTVILLSITITPFY